MPAQAWLGHDGWSISLCNSQCQGPRSTSRGSFLVRYVFFTLQISGFLERSENRLRPALYTDAIAILAAADNQSFRRFETDSFIILSQAGDRWNTGAGPTLERIRAIGGAGIPVMGHLGLTPQSATQLGGFKAQGRTADAALQLVEDAILVQEAGAFALVLECVPAEIAGAITERLRIPTIGIGAGNRTDGQVLVWHDLLGLGAGSSPRFVERYADLHRASVDALGRYVADVRSRAFPEARHTYAIADDELAAFQAGLAAAAL